MSEIERIGRYEVIEILGRGGASTVYRARDPMIGREVALKTLDLGKVGPRSAEYRERFEREARAAGQLDHPGIVTVYDVGEDEPGSLLFLAMEFIEGGTLADLQAASVRCQPWHVAELGARVAEALQAAHEAGIVHRDVKPANILLGRDGSVKLTDFGIARLGVSELTRSGSTMGTPYYMAPEQITGRPVDGRADLYAIGVILFELLAGRRPFSGAGIGELVHRIMSAEPPPLDVLAPGLPPALVALVHRCLAKDPDERIPSGRGLAAALRDACPSPQGHGELPWQAAHYALRPAVVVDSDARTLPGEPFHTREIDASPTTRVASPRLEVEPATPRRRIARLTMLLTLVAAATAAIVAVARRPVGPPTTTDATVRHAAVELTRAAELLERGDLEGAQAAAMAVLAVEPRSPSAQQIVAEAQAELDRQRLAALEERLTDPPQPPRDAPTATARPPASPRTAPRTVRAAANAAPTGPPTLSISFPSPLSHGSLVVEVDGDRVDELRWDFRERGFLGLPKDREGKVTAELVMPAGRHRLRLELHSGRRGQIAAHEFEHDFPVGSRWSLSIRMDDVRATPEFELEPSDSG